jgi:hypothetical protein
MVPSGLRLFYEGDLGASAGVGRRDTRPRWVSTRKDPDDRRSQMPHRTVTAVALAATLAVPGVAAGHADPRPFHDVQSTVDSGVVDYSCFEGNVGNGMTTDVIDGHFTPNDNGVHFAGVIHREYTLAFGDGTHILGHVVQGISFNATRSGVTTDTEPFRETATVYGADGSPLGTINIRGAFHATYLDANGNGEPDSGEVRAASNRLSVRCPAGVPGGASG